MTNIPEEIQRFISNAFSSGSKKKKLVSLSSHFRSFVENINVGAILLGDGVSCAALDWHSVISAEMELVVTTIYFQLFC